MTGEYGGVRTRRVKPAAFILTVVFVVAAVAAISFYFPKSPEGHSTTTISSSTVTSSSYVLSSQTTKSSLQTTGSTSASQLSPSGLKLTLMSNATIIHSSQSIDAVATIYNTQTQNTTVYPNSTQYGYLADWGSYLMGRCPGFSESALSIAIFRGHYTVANFSSPAYPLLLNPPQNFGCPALPPLESLEFLPHNDTAEALYNDTIAGPQHIVLSMTAELVSACATSNNACTYTPGVNGYWTVLPNPPGTNFVFHYFDPGNYTIVAADSWGQTVYMYFEVV